MRDKLKMLEMLVDEIGTAPTLAEMPQRTLQDKGIAGPTSAHVIEQLHTPMNLAYVTFTTGSSAFQNIVGVTHEELPQRIAAACRVFQLAGVTAGQRMLVTYPPLVNVFSLAALAEAEVSHDFLLRSCQDALLLALIKKDYQVVLGESSFLRATLQQAITLGLAKLLPKKLCLLAAGTPLDLELLDIASQLDYSVHDLYGSQEFGWLALDGILLRDDLSLVASPRGQEYVEVVVGGMPTGDSFPLARQSHICNRQGHLLTYKRQRTQPNYEVVVTATPQHSRELIEKTARTLLRIKGCIVKVAANLVLEATATQLRLTPSLPLGEPGISGAEIMISGPVATQMFDTLVQAQFAFETQAKSDPTWLKRR
ncbi:acyl carrier protein [Chania multitudinisentens RB-25]|uniref:Acyl carrier protein n=1 Tax=Chania multitudinisentens RB-25 TaxID=1441930 RepID=W0LF32_9GAMM|nr:acyl carrier protein [Chania multitudinisentens]AHG22473.1 acyl carrier protein [Chania multitudinisentens RB-25]